MVLASLVALIGSRRLDGGTHPPEAIMIPRPVVVIVVLVLLLILCADVGAQFVVPGHTANPVIDGAIIALIGAIITGTKGPKPEAPPNLAAEPPAPATPRAADEERPPGRHHYKDWP